MALQTALGIAFCLQRTCWRAGIITNGMAYVNHCCGTDRPSDRMEPHVPNINPVSDALGIP